MMWKTTLRAVQLLFLMYSPNSQHAKKKRNALKFVEIIHVFGQLQLLYGARKVTRERHTIFFIIYSCKSPAVSKYVFL